MNAQITAIGAYVPPQIITNSWFKSVVDTNEEWIVSRTGIRERRFASKDTFTSDIALEAVNNLLQDNPGVSLAGVDFIIVATTTADQVMPSMASQVQHQLNLPNVGCVDIMAACAGFVYGIVMAKGLIAGGSHKKVLVIAAELLSKATDYTDRTSCILFGDGAGVALIEASTHPKIFNGITGTDGSHGKDLYLSHYDNKVNGETIKPDGNIHQNGRVIYKWAVQNMPVKIRELLALNNLELADLDWIILHSANLRIIEAVAAELDYPIEKMLTSVEQFGNTSSASIPLAWHLGIQAGKVKQGNKILLLGFGGGVTFAGVIIEI